MSSIKESKLVVQETTVAWECDVCSARTAKSEQYHQEWYHFSKSHQGWGNDSVDSYDSLDVCSVACFVKYLQDSIPDILEYADSSAEIADMPVKFAQKLLDSLLEGKNEC